MYVRIVLVFTILRSSIVRLMLRFGMLFQHTFAAELHRKLEGFVRESEGLDIKQHFLLYTYVQCKWFYAKCKNGCGFTNRERFTGSCGSLVRVVHWFVRFTGSCGSLVHEVHWFVWFTGS